MNLCNPISCGMNIPAERKSHLLLVCDQWPDRQDKLPVTGAEVEVLSVSGDQTVNDRIRRDLINMGADHIRFLDAALMIKAESERVRDDIAHWSCRIGMGTTGDRTLREQLEIPDLGTSAWWFGILSEKNTFKTPAFLELAQFNAIRRVALDKPYQRLVIQLKNYRLRKALKNLAHYNGLNVSFLKNLRPETLSGLLRRALARPPFIVAILRGLVTLTLFGRTCIQIKRYFRRRTICRDHRLASLFVCYSPSIDGAALQVGSYRNNYFGGLQDKFIDWHKSICWLLLEVSQPGEQLAASLRRIDAVSDLGEEVYFIHEFFKFGLVCKVLRQWGRQILYSLQWYHQMRMILAQTPGHRESLPIIKPLWHDSLCGVGAMEGLLFGWTFKEALQELTDIDEVVYPAEMHAWEKALIAACQRIQPDVTVIGVQHAAISSHFYHFSYDPSELKSIAAVPTMPLPTFLAISGSLTPKLLENSAYPNIRRAEALRYLYIGQLLAKGADLKHKSNVLLVAGSINRDETTTLVNMVSRAFPQIGGFEIWFKGHPRCPFGEIFKTRGIDPEKCGYQIRDGNIADALRVARAVLVPTSTVALEALAYGCDVFIPLVPDALLMNPLVDYHEYYQQVTTSQDLKEKIEQAMHAGSPPDMDGRKEFLKAYWDTTPDLPRWKALLQ